MTAPANGVIQEFFVNDGDKVEKGQQLFKLVLTGRIIVFISVKVYRHGCLDNTTCANTHADITH